ncbi:MAG: methylated-DNA--[protein]-cysteine S-methyltransferase [Acidobacteria bacterium]|nr:methylated-DNA--[protein]-cysteine S-methyltransferase [Acidobacteriota bacterium]
MERAYLERDAAYDGLFFLGVRSTSIFCRPTCPARKPLPRNVEYFPTARAALFAGYRPCKRCRPLAEDDSPEWSSRLLAEVEQDPGSRITDADLKARGIDPATVRRFFLRRYGMTFQAFTRARRLSGALTRIREGAALDHVVFESGYDSHSGFRDAFTRTFGETPGSRPNGECVFLSWFQSPLGPLVAGATSEGVCLLEFSDRRMLETQFATVRKLFSGPVLPGSNDHLNLLQSELSGYFSGTLKRFTVPLHYPGTPFQRRVWEQLLAIPYGETRSYEQLATALGDAKAVRAVGRANGLNRIAIVIPCHRVINKNGELGGYGGGLRRKQYLLDLERSGCVEQAAPMGKSDGPLLDGLREIEVAHPSLRH